MKRNNAQKISTGDANTPLADLLTRSVKSPRSKFDMEKHEKVQAQARKQRFSFALFAVAVLIVLVWMLRAPAAVHRGYPGLGVVAKLEAQVVALDATVRAIKKTGVIMEKDGLSLNATRELQQATRDLIAAKYGDYDTTTSVFRVKVDMELQPSVPNYTEHDKYHSFWIELAPVALMPCSVFNFMEIVTTFKSGAFDRNAPHVMQATVQSKITQPMAFQEYSPEFPHRKSTVGYAGRPGGPAWYVSLQDNTYNHGPGSQQAQNPYEADPCFGRVLGGIERHVISRLHRKLAFGWLARENYVFIPRMTLFVPDEGGAAAVAEGNIREKWSAGYVKWQRNV